MYNYIIVGAGLTGCILAERLAKNNKVLLIEKKAHVGGTCYDFYNEHGILVHKYGPHIFNTNDKEVWDYISQFTEFHIYHHRVLGVVEGKKIPIPFNLESLYKIFPKTYACKIEEKLLKKYAVNTKIPIMDLLNQEDEDLKYLANYVYENVFLHYTQKQWGMTPEQVGSAAMARIPFYLSRDDRYFQNQYQGIPKNGYTEIFRKMLSNKNIHVLLNTDYKEVLKIDEKEKGFKLFDNKFDGRVIFTGAVDELFNYRFGDLPYRTLNFVFETYEQEYFQEICTVNYPNNYDFTRITEFKYMTKQKSNMTTIVKEFPMQYDYKNEKLEPYYPIPKEENEKLYQKYVELSKEFDNLILAGRLGNYRYFNMSETIKNALEVYRKL